MGPSCVRVARGKRPVNISANLSALGRPTTESADRRKSLAADRPPESPKIVTRAAELAGSLERIAEAPVTDRHDDGAIGKFFDARGDGYRADAGWAQATRPPRPPVVRTSRRTRER